MIATTFKEIMGGLMEATLFITEMLNKQNMAHVINKDELKKVENNLLEIFREYDGHLTEYDKIVDRLEADENIQLAQEAENNPPLTLSES